MKKLLLVLLLMVWCSATAQNTDVNRLLDRFEFASNKFMGKRPTSGFNEFDLIKVNNKYHLYHFSNNSVYYRCHTNPDSLVVAPETLAVSGVSVPSVLYEGGTWHLWVSIGTSPVSTCHYTSGRPSGGFTPRDTIVNTGDFSVRKCPYNNDYYGIGLTTNTTTRKCVLFTSSSLDQSWTNRGDVTNGDQEWVLNLTSSFADPMLFFYNGSSYLLIVGYIPGVTGSVGLCQFDYIRYRVISNTIDVCKASDTISIPFNPVFLDDSVNSPRIYYVDQAWGKDGYIAYNEAYHEINVNVIDSAKVNGLLTTNKIDIKVSGKDSVNAIFNLNNNQITIKNDLSSGSKEIKFTVPKSDSNIYKVVKIINSVRVDSFYTKSFNTIVFTDSIDDAGTATWIYTKFVTKKYGLKSKFINLVRDGKYIYSNETSSQVVLTSVGFPTGWASRALITGLDIVPVLPDSTICNRYIRRFDKNTGLLEMVVNLPRVRRLTSYPFSLQLGDSVTTNNSSSAFSNRTLSWSFTDSTGSVIDETGNNNNGTIVNSGNIQRVSDGNKRIIKVLDASSYIDFTNFNTFYGATPFTFITKAKFLDTSGTKWMWGHYSNPTTNAFILSVAGGTTKRSTIQLSRTKSRQAYKEYPATYKDMMLYWHDYCVTYDPTKSGNDKLKLYIDDGNSPLTYTESVTDTLPDLRTATTHVSGIATGICMDNQEILIGKSMSLGEWRNYRITTLDSNFAFVFIDTVGNNRINITAQPENDTVLSGQQGVFTVGYTGDSVQIAWYKNNVFTGVYGDTLRIAGNNGDSVQAVMWNDDDTISSSKVYLTVYTMRTDSIGIYTGPYLKGQYDLESDSIKLDGLDITSFTYTDSTVYFAAPAPMMWKRGKQIGGKYLCRMYTPYGNHNVYIDLRKYGSVIQMKPTSTNVGVGF